MTETLELTIARTIPASQKTVFEAWLDPVALAKFMKPGSDMQDARVEVDAREGGTFLIAMRAGDQELPHRGRYETIDRYDKLVFTWESSYTLPGSTVTIDFRELGPNETEVTLHHVGFPSDEARRNHEGGWGMILDLSSKVVS